MHTTTSDKNPQKKYLRFFLLPHLTSHSCEITNLYKMKQLRGVTYHILNDICHSKILALKSTFP